jgi:hypothetical protein
VEKYQSRVSVVEAWSQFGSLEDGKSPPLETVERESDTTAKGIKWGRNREKFRIIEFARERRIKEKRINTEVTEEV